MPIVSVTSDPATLTLTSIGEYPVPVELLWGAWADPRQLERFWGPPTWPATFRRHDMQAGGRSEYSMTGPNGEKSNGYWVFEEVVPTSRFVVRDGFADEAGQANDGMPSCRMEMRFESLPGGGSRYVGVTTFPSAEAMQAMVQMGMVEGLTAAMGQLDAVLADLRDHARGFVTNLVVEDDTHVVVTREVRGPLALVWRAHHEASLMQKWLLGPDGWSMPVCEVAAKVGDTYRYEWESADKAQRFGFTGSLVESESPRREVTTESMIGTEGPHTVNELVLTPLPGDRTLIRLRITYPSKELRDLILGTGMVDGMETSYARLEREVLA